MTDEKLDQLEAACSAKADTDGKVRLDSGDVLELVRDLRELRKHAAGLSALEGAVATMHRLMGDLCAYHARPQGIGANVDSRIAVQDPGR
jgi:hypothetical protein